MAENTKKFFLDLAGLNTLWEKMKNTFAGKDDVTVLETAVSQLDTDVKTLDNEFDSLSARVDNITPKKETTYSDALNIVDKLSEGTVIKVSTAETIDNKTYAAGLYIVDSHTDGTKFIKYIGTSSGTGEEGGIDGLTTRVETLENSAIKAATIIAGDKTQDVVISENTLMIQYDDIFVTNSESMNALTHSAIAKKFSEIETKIAGIKLGFEIVNELPTDGISLSTIYLKRAEGNSNSYEEYIYIQSIGWEKLGEQTIDVSNFVTNETLSTMLNAYAKTSDVKNYIATAIAEHNATIEAIYATKEEVKAVTDRLDVIEGLSGDWVTEAEILASIQSNEEGSIGRTIAISLNDIEQLN
jgi:hypothetical protein